MKKCVFAGVFDPFTKGHLSVVERASKIFDEVFVAVADNTQKRPVADGETRTKLVCQSIEFNNVKVERFDGLLIDFCLANGINCIVKGVRNSSDFDYEKEMFNANLNLGGVDTLFMPALPQLSFVSSTFVNELLTLGKDAGEFVPKTIYAEVFRLYSKRATTVK
jgi:pantetheine-phosphate adenylyltransferase